MSPTFRAMMANAAKPPSPIAISAEQAPAVAAVSLALAAGAGWLAWRRWF
jgi:hypothetical protein